MFRYQKWFTLDKKTHTKNIFGSSVKQIKLNITDTAGQEEMVSLLDKHLEGKDVGEYESSFDFFSLLQFYWC